jgi:hypothetical protein
MNGQAHRAIAERIERSLAKCGPADYEMRIEAAMLAGTHWLNVALHDMGVTRPENDVFHTYLLTINEHRRLSLADEALVTALGKIEDLRPAFVRGDLPGGERAAECALRLLGLIRARAVARGLRNEGGHECSRYA